MNELFQVWKKPKMVKAIFLTALVYAALTIPFKGVTFIPNLSELRPSAFIPVLAGFIFGPAGAWGAALGNLIGDFFGTLSYASIFGFVANFIFAYLPYKLWYHIFRKNKSQLEIEVHRKKDIFDAFLSGVMVNFLVAFIIAWGVFATVEGNFVLIWQVLIINNTLSLLLLMPALIWLVPMSRHYELNWFSHLNKGDFPSTPTKAFYLIAMLFFTILGTLLVFGLIYLEAFLGTNHNLYGLVKGSIFFVGIFNLTLALIFAFKE